MRYVPSGAPWSERGGRIRGVVDLVTGRYPAFLFGFPVGNILPVFHFHETSPAALEPAFAYLADNGYRTATCDDMARVAHGETPPPRTVVLAFDDALASLWMVVFPLLKKYGLRAVAYAIPGRVKDAGAVRPTLDDGPVDPDADTSPCPLATWPELRAMSANGAIDIQSHTWSHSMIFCGSTATGVVGDEDTADHFLNRPRVNVGDPPAFLDGTRYGHPLFPRRSRMSNARRFLPDESSVAEIEAFVADRGGRAFLARPSARAELAPRLARVTGRWETDAERDAAVTHELIAARDTLEARLAVPVRHVCLPWGVTSPLTRSLVERLGFQTAVANRFSGQLAIRPGDDPYFLKRLPHRHIFALPGRGRRAWRTLA